MRHVWFVDFVSQAEQAPKWCNFWSVKQEIVFNLENYFFSCSINVFMLYLELNICCVLFLWVFPLLQLLLKRTLERPHWREPPMFMVACRKLTKYLIAIYEMKCGFFTSLHVHTSWNWFFFFPFFPKGFTCKAPFSQGGENCFLPDAFPLLLTVLYFNTNITQSRAKYFYTFSVS